MRYSCRRPMNRRDSPGTCRPPAILQPGTHAGLRRYRQSGRIGSCFAGTPPTSKYPGCAAKRRSSCASVSDMETKNESQGGNPNVEVLLSLAIGDRRLLAGCSADPSGPSVVMIVSEGEWPPTATQRRALFHSRSGRKLAARSSQGTFRQFDPALAGQPGGS